ncbi:MAG TPA: SRPBCC family protein [Pyrinomonadaceae bacterium]
MATIHLETFIRAPPEVCFDLCLDVNFHERAGHGRAVAGTTSGALRFGDTVTWEATHFLVRQRLTSKIVEYDRPRRFVDEMQRGAFARWRHEHRFVGRRGGTLAVDDVDFAAPLGPLGKLVDAVLLESYMTRFLVRHNVHFKREAEALAAREAGAARAAGAAPRHTR